MFGAQTCDTTSNMALVVGLGFSLTNWEEQVFSKEPYVLLGELIDPFTMSLT